MVSMLMCPKCGKRIFYPRGSFEDRCECRKETRKRFAKKGKNEN